MNQIAVCLHIDIPERTVHPKAFDLDRLITRSLMETLQAVESIDTKIRGILVIDNITHLWEAARAACKSKVLPNGGIPIQTCQLLLRIWAEDSMSGCGK